MKTLTKSLFLACCIMFVACEDIVEGINDDPNNITLEEVDALLFLTGTQLANTSMQVGHLNRVSGMWSGQLTGFTSLYSNIYGYSISSAESTGTWSRIYIGVLTNARFIQEKATTNQLKGIAKVIEAHAIGSGASIFGDVPYSEANNPEIADPKFDSQMAVLTSAINVLDGALSDLSGASSGSISQDIYFGGDVASWIGVANTLKARYYMHMKDYAGAYAAAQAGISSAAGSMMHIPRGDAAVQNGDKNLFYEILAGSRGGDIGSGPNDYLVQILDPANAASRNNAKTDETARAAYYFVDSNNGSPGIISQFEPQMLVSYIENLLILAEAGARTSGLATGLTHLNEARAYWAGGGHINDNFNTMPLLYDAYVAADFAAGGMENADGIDDTRALIREIVEERYVSGFGTFMPFDDMRRLRKSDSDVAVPVPFNTNTATQHPERFPYSTDELNSNENAPTEPGIYATTEVNQ